MHVLELKTICFLFHLPTSFIIVVFSLLVHDGIDKVGRPKYRGVIHAVRSVVRQDGVLGLYRVRDLLDNLCSRE